MRATDRLLRRAKRVTPAENIDGDGRGAGRLSARSLSATVVRVYGGGWSARQLMNRYRPRICPFELLIPQVPVGSRVLDVGCGTGLFLNLLCAEGRLSGAPGASTGFDVSPAALGAARRAAASAGHDGVAFVPCDAGGDWPRGPFDVVSIVDVMHHLPPSLWRGTIGRAAAALRPGGVLLYKDMCRRPLWRSAANRAHDLVVAKQWIRYAPIDEVADWCADEGLTVRSRGAASRWWYGHEWIIAERPGADGESA